MSNTGLAPRRCGDVALAVIALYLLGSGAMGAPLLLYQHGGPLAAERPIVYLSLLTTLVSAMAGVLLMRRRRWLLDSLAVRDALTSPARQREDLLVVGLAALGVWYVARSAILLVQPLWIVLAGSYTYGAAELVELLLLVAGVLLVVCARVLARHCPAVRA